MWNIQIPTPQAPLLAGLEHLLKFDILIVSRRIKQRRRVLIYISCYIWTLTQGSSYLLVFSIIFRISPYILNPPFWSLTPYFSHTKKIVKASVSLPLNRGLGTLPLLLSSNGACLANLTEFEVRLLTSWIRTYIQNSKTWLDLSSYVLELSLAIS
jgi:hypothetical protein